MYVVTGATGHVGSSIVDQLLSQSVPVRAVIRSETKAESFTSRNVEVALADLTNTDALVKAFQGAKVVFVMNPPAYASSNMQAVAVKVSNALALAVKAAQVPRIVILSSIGAERSSGTGSIRTTHILEEALKGTAPQVVIVRCAAFIENWLSSVLAIKAGQSPVLNSMYQKLDHKIPHIATDDIGRVVAEYLTKSYGEVAKSVLIELEGPEPYSPNDVAKLISKTLGKTIPAIAMSDDMIWELCDQLGWPKTTGDNFIEMMKAYDNSIICWTTNENSIRVKGKLTLDDVLGKVLN
ncbi:unnamed protein product [Didymodactylos carnosus]|uniref:NmrA-like domain-containing protein n=1 Tax=Didymodactylos carnosus TaxID=1234261 RepID=A0A8S2FUX5_9BILA|nr:unnamed protein product [Didymodactylos carnosus]CAF4357477.1 unnamed protein product [Didymodactylos carnosus]